jgi:hypothetical protein
MPVAFFPKRFYQVLDLGFTGIVLDLIEGSMK